MQVVVALALLCLVHAQQFLIPAVQYGGFQVIFSNDTSFLDEIDVHRNTIYAAGQGVVREIIEQPFSLDYSTRYFQQQHRFIDFKAFTDVNNKTWVFGPTTAHNTGGLQGYSHPFQIASNDSSYVADLGSGIMYSSVHLYTSNVSSQTLAYVVGWVLNTGNIANLAINRLTINGGSFASNNFFTANEYPLVLNATTGFDDYYRTYKPKIFRARSPLYYAMVVDPSSHCVYKVNIGNDDQIDKKELGLLGSVCLPVGISGSTFDSDTERLYVGIKGVGSAPGSIIVVATNQLAIVNTIALEQFQSNPTTLFYRDNYLWVGFYGSASIVKFDFRPQGKTKYSTLPWYLRSVSALHVRSEDKVFFVTNEQFSKVAMADDVHFCYTTCDTHFGYCANSQCKCVNGTTLQEDGRTCLTTTVLPEEGVNSSHAGEVALGLLFIVTFIAAAILGFLLWKTTRHAKSGGYGGGSHEHDRILGDEDH